MPLLGFCIGGEALWWRMNVYAIIRSCVKDRRHYGGQWIIMPLLFIFFNGRRFYDGWWVFITFSFLCSGKKVLCVCVWGGIIIVCLVKNQIGKKVLCVGVSLLDAWSICIMLVLLVEGREYYYGQFIFISLFFVNLLQNVFQ